MNHSKSLAVASLAVLLLAACGSSGMGDILGGGGNTQSNVYEIRGTVDSVDTASRSIYLTNVSGYSNMLSNGGGSSVRVYYDNDTRVVFNGSTYHPQDLERGDEVSVRVDESGNSLMAEDVTVIRDVSSGGTSTYPSTSTSTIRGTVRYVDTSRRTIEVDRGYGTTVFVEYDTATPVYFGNQTYRAADLERGDEIEIRTRDIGGGRFAAQDITVTRNVSGGTPGSSTSTATQTIRGTVRSIDFDRRLIELESASWISGFNTGAGSGTSRFTIHFDQNASIDVSGRLQPISGLERGDVIEVRVTQSGGQYWADRLLLVRDVRQ